MAFTDMAVEHLVLLAADRRLLTAELHQDVLSLADRVRAELGISLENSVVFSDTPDSDITGILSHWRFSSQEDLTIFRESKAHLLHLQRMSPVLLAKQIIDLSS